MQTPLLSRALLRSVQRQACRWPLPSSPLPLGARSVWPPARRLLSSSCTAASSSSSSSALVVAEHWNSLLAPAALAAITAARQVSGNGGIDVLLFNSAKSDVHEAARHAARLDGVERVLTVDDERFAHGIAEVVAPAVVAVHAERSGYTHVLAGGSTFGKNVMPRVAAALDTQQVSDISQVVSASTFVRPIYAGNALARVESSDAVRVVTVRGTAFDAPAEKGAAADAGAVEVKDVTAIANAATEAATPLSEWVSEELTESDRPQLDSARVVVSGGRGLKSTEQFREVLAPLADKLGAALGATRAAVDSGMCPNDMQVGQTGKVVAPELYIAVGVSGAIQHLAGMKDSKMIVAINKDADAPIFQVADVGLVADLFEAVPELVGKL